MWTSPIYEQTIRKYHKADGWKAILVYLMVLALVFSSVGFTERILKTNCLWGAIVLHLLYNAVGAMVMFR